MKIRINPRKKHLKEEYNKYLNLWYEQHEQAQRCIKNILENEDVEYCKDELDTMRIAIKEERKYSDKMDQIKKEYSLLRWFILE